MSHIERIYTSMNRYIDFERCQCTSDGCDKILINDQQTSRKDVEHALKCLFGEATPGSRWFTGASRDGGSA